MMMYLPSFLTKEFQAGIAISIIIVVPIALESFASGAIIIERDVSALIIPSLIGVLMTVHYSIEYFLDYLTEAVVIKHFGIMLGLLGSNAVIIAEAAEIFTLYPFCASMALHIQVIITMFELHSILELCFEAKYSSRLTLTRSPYSILVAMLSVCSIGHIMTPHNKLPIQIISVVLSLFTVAFIIGAWYSWFKSYSISDAVSTQYNGVNLKKRQKKYLLAMMGILSVFYSIGMLLYNLSLVYADPIIAQRMTLMMYYLNNVCVYIMLLQESVIRRLHCVQLKVIGEQRNI